jgi:hypothetical protein
MLSLLIIMQIFLVDIPNSKSQLLWDWDQKDKQINLKLLKFQKMVSLKSEKSKQELFQLQATQCNQHALFLEMKMEINSAFLLGTQFS